jgi:hypothetical protein
MCKWLWIMQRKQNQRRESLANNDDVSWFFVRFCCLNQGSLAVVFSNALAPSIG